MAQYSITRACRHVESVDIRGTNAHGEHARRAEWEAGRDCRACFAAAKRRQQEELAARATAVAKAEGWPDLTGSDRQVAWAQDIRGLMIAALAERLGEDPVLAVYVTVALRQTNAGWWIDRRGLTQRIRNFMDLVQDAGAAHANYGSLLEAVEAEMTEQERELATKERLMPISAIDPVTLLDWCEGHALPPQAISEALAAQLDAAGLDDRRSNRAGYLAGMRIKRLIHQQIPDEVMRVNRRQTIWAPPDPAPNPLTEFAPQLPGIIEQATATVLAHLDDVIAEADEELRRLAAIRDADRRADEIRSRARLIRERLADAATHRRAIMMDVGQIARDALQLKADYPDLSSTVEMTWIAEETGLTRPTVNKYRDQVADSNSPISQLDNAELARLHAGYGYGGHDEIDTEFWARYPVLAGWRQAIHHLYEVQTRQWTAEHPDEVMPPLDLPEPAGAGELQREYQRIVDRIAGTPTPVV